MRYGTGEALSFYVMLGSQASQNRAYSLLSPVIFYKEVLRPHLVPPFLVVATHQKTPSHYNKLYPRTLHTITYSTKQAAFNQYAYRSSSRGWSQGHHQQPEVLAGGQEPLQTRVGERFRWRRQFVTHRYIQLLCAA